MTLSHLERVALKRHNARSRGYIRGGIRYMVEALEPGRKYSVRRGSGSRVTVWADSCDNAMTNYLRNS